MKGRAFFPALACAALLISSVGAHAESETLLLRKIGFAACHKSVDGILKTTKPEQHQVFREVDTGAILRVRVVASASDLVMVCNKVTESIKITRETPGLMAQDG